MSKGIVYLLDGMSYMERMVVSIWSLRKFYGGPITIFVRRYDENKVELFKKDLDCDIKPFTAPNTEGNSMLVKTRIPELTPYEDTVFLDADTLIVGRVQKLFGRDLTLVRYGNRWTRDKLPKKWIGSWKDVGVDINALVEAQLAEKLPFINTGVFGFRKGNLELRQWRQLADRNRDARMVDELAMQLLTSKLSHRMMSDKYNRCPQWGKETEDIRIWHFHGKRHCSKKDNCQDVWIPAFREACEEGVCELQRWAGKYDRRLRSYLKEHSPVKSD